MLAEMIESNCYAKLSYLKQLLKIFIHWC